ncbi:MAG: L,D-transpeptidase [Methyloceanibacter sp.]
MAKERASRRTVVAQLLLGTALLGCFNLLPAATARAARRKGKGGKSASPAAAPSEEGKNLKPGQFTWHPERAPSGPVAIIVSVPKQRVYVYRNGILIGVSTCSTGKKGYETPTGVFTILQKAEDHYSSEFDDAPMPHMERLTWSGVALHAGKLPGYPASHGCVRLPPKFAESLYTVTQIGTPVIIAGDYTDPAAVKDPGPVLGSSAKEQIDAKVGKKAAGASNAVTSILVSRADNRIYVLQGGAIVAEGEANIKDPAKPIGSNVFIWQGGDKDGSSWDGMGFHADGEGAVAPSTAVLERIEGSDEVMAAVKKRLKPGTVLVTTDLAATPDTRSDKSMVVMDGPGN